MTFGERRDCKPDALCVCGHRASNHLYCGDHICVNNRECDCTGFTPVNFEAWTKADRPIADPQMS